MVAILKFVIPEWTSTHPQDHSWEVSLQSAKILYFMAMMKIAHLHIPMIIPVKFHYYRIFKKIFNFHDYHNNGDHFEKIRP